MLKRGIYISFVFLLLISCTQITSYKYNEGQIFGTFYHIQYQSTNDYQTEIQEALNQVNASLSTYDPTSTISKINKNESTEADAHFLKVFEEGQAISKATDGAFDMTVTSLVNVWGFGFEKMSFPDSSSIDSLLQYVGYKNIRNVGSNIHKTHPNFRIDASAIAKGYGVDVVAELLESKGIQNYLVEIGGEIRLKGLNKKGQKWTVGIDKPEEFNFDSNKEIQEIIALNQGAVATSGNYRQFYVKEGKKYSHTIDPKTGYPVNHNILSASVYAKDCMKADAYATAIMVMGVEKTMAFSKNHPDLGIYIIYAKDSLQNKVWMNEQFKGLIKN